MIAITTNSSIKVKPQAAATLVLEFSHALFLTFFKSPWSLFVHEDDFPFLVDGIFLARRRWWHIQFAQGYKLVEIAIQFPAGHRVVQYLRQLDQPGIHF